MPDPGGNGCRGDPFPAKGEVAALRGVAAMPRPEELAIELTGEILPIMDVDGNPSPSPSRAGPIADEGGGGVGADR
jgi:hypothetical protein